MGKRRDYRKLLMLVHHRRWWWVYYYRLDYVVPRLAFMLAIVGAVAALGWWLLG